jgi:hypothetical protein
VQIPTDLLVGTDKTLEARLRNSFSLLEGKESLVVQIADADPDTGEARLDKQGKPLMVSYSELAIEDERKKIYTDFLTPVPGHGQLISKMRRKAFDTRLEWFKARVAAYTVAVKQQLDQAVEASVKDLTQALLPGVMQRPPARLMKYSMSLDTHRRRLPCSGRSRALASIQPGGQVLPADGEGDLQGPDLRDHHR